MNLLVTADLHLGKTSSALSPGSAHASTRMAWENLVDLAIDQQADALLIAGDLVDRDNMFFEAQNALTSGFDRLGDAGISVVLTAGNHDFEALGNILTNYKAEHVHLLGSGGTWQHLDLMLAGTPVRFLGWSFPRRHVSTDPLDDLDSALHPGDTLTIGLVHGDFEVPDSTYAPLSEQSLARSGVDAWVLGHIHKPSVLRDLHPLVLYPGSPQALSSKEPGPHGPWMLEVTGRTIRQRPIPVSPVRYESLEVRVDGVGEQTEFYSLITNAVQQFNSQQAPSLEQVHSLVVDLLVTGRPVQPARFRSFMHNLVLNQDDLQLSLDSAGSHTISVRIRSVSDALQGPEADLDSLMREPGPAGLLARVIRALDALDTSTPIHPTDEQAKRIAHALLEEAGKRIETLNRNNSFADLRPDPERPYVDAVHVDAANRQQITAYARKEAVRLLDTLLETHPANRTQA